MILHHHNAMNHGICVLNEHGLSTTWLIHDNGKTYYYGEHILYIHQTMILATTIYEPDTMFLP